MIRNGAMPSHGSIEVAPSMLRRQCYGACRQPGFCDVFPWGTGRGDCGSGQRDENLLAGIHGIVTFEKPTARSRRLALV
jgi:hypothetical protein